MEGRTRIRLGVIGFGEWGPNHVRTFANLPESEVLGIADPRSERREAAQRRFRDCRAFRTHAEMLDSLSLDAVVVATSTATHAEIVREVLNRGLHVLCEKPLCLDAKEALSLSRLADRKERALMVGHVFLFNAGILLLRRLVQEREIGAILYMTCNRTNLGPIRNDVNVAWDLASHDIAIANFVLNRRPTSVSAVGQSYLRQGVPDVAFVTLTYPGGILVNIHVSWLHPSKVRGITLVGDRRMATWDDLERIGPVRLFDKGVIREQDYADFGAFQLLMREGDITIPRVPMEEPLLVQARHFLGVIRGKEKCLSDGRVATDVIRVLEAIDRSMERKGRAEPVKA
ncbi:MAG: Gfo/Idh/MocA family oxidoreductase [Planctomycetota bacterium]